MNNFAYLPYCFLPSDKNRSHHVTITKTRIAVRMHDAE